MLTTDLINYLDELLQPNRFDDYCPNGLQVEGKNEIKTIISGVSASQDLIDKAVSRKVDALLVHHGMFWKNDDIQITGIKKNRLRLLLEKNINLIAYHLPLDANNIYGNNVKLAQLLNIDIDKKFTKQFNTDIVLHGKLKKTVPGDTLDSQINKCLHRKTICILKASQDLLKELLGALEAGKVILTKLSHLEQMHL